MPCPDRANSPTARPQVEDALPHSGPKIVGTLVVFAGVASVAAAAVAEIPFLSHAWASLTDSVAPALSSLGATVASVAPLASVASSVASVAHADAGVSSVDASVLPKRQTAPLSSAQLGAPLVHGPFVSACGATNDMKVVVTLAVKLGRASDVTVKTIPPSPGVESCVDGAVRDLRWDVSPIAGHLTVTY